VKQKKKSRKRETVGNEFKKLKEMKLAKDMKSRKRKEEKQITEMK
jgi:hypothetical protein